MRSEIEKLQNIDITTERLVLRNLEPHDITQDYVDWLNDPEVNKYLSHRGSFQTTNSCADYILSFQGKSDCAVIGIFDRLNQDHIGNMTYSRIDWDRKYAVVGIGVGRKAYWGKGFASEAFQSFIQFSFQQLHLHRLQAHIAAKNIDSLKFFLRNYFKIEGLLRDGEYLDGRWQDAYILGIVETDIDTLS